MAARGKRVSALVSARSLRQKPNEQLEQIALTNAHDERTLWAVLGVLQQRHGGELLKTKIRGRLIFKKPLSVRCARVPFGPRRNRERRRDHGMRHWHTSSSFAVVVAVVRVMLDGVRSLGMYLTD